MESKFIKDITNYIVVRKQDESEMLAQFDRYNGNIYWTDDIENATKFESKESANQFSNLQNQISNLMNLNFKFNVLENHNVISEVSD